MTLVSLENLEYGTPGNIPPTNSIHSLSQLTLKHLMALIEEDCCCYGCEIVFESFLNLATYDKNNNQASLIKCKFVQTIEPHEQP